MKRQLHEHQLNTSDACDASAGKDPEHGGQSVMDEKSLQHPHILRTGCVTQCQCRWQAPSSCFGTEFDPRSHVLWFYGETFNPYEELWFLASRQRALIHNCECVCVHICAIMPSVLLSENQVLNALWLGFKLIPCFLSEATFCLNEPNRKDRILPLHCTCSIFISEK